MQHTSPILSWRSTRCTGIAVLLLASLGVAGSDLFAEQTGTPAKKGWPMTCFASGVNAAQAGELRDHLAKSGVPTEVTPDGDPVYRDANHRRKALKARGLHDKNSFL